jgi:hypothetical protein
MESEKSLFMTVQKQLGPDTPIFPPFLLDYEGKSNRKAEERKKSEEEMENARKESD